MKNFSKLGILIMVYFLGIGMSCNRDDTQAFNSKYNGRTMAVFNPEKTYGQMADVDGNIYKTIKIGDQTWMAENLRVTHFRNGEEIPLVTDTFTWTRAAGAAFCNYNNTEDIDTIATYGCLYNGYAATTPKLAPKGWHVPTNEEWITLENYLIANGYNYDGTTIDDKVAKSLSSRYLWEYSAEVGVHGKSDYNEYINKSGFTAVPGGEYYSRTDKYSSIGFITYFWSASFHTNISIHNSSVNYKQDFFVHGYSHITSGYSVRCVKD